MLLLLLDELKNLKMSGNFFLNSSTSQSKPFLLWIWSECSRICFLNPYCINQINRSLLFFFLHGISSLFVFLEISVARSSSIEEKRCGGKLFISICILNAEILTHFSICFTYFTSFIPTSKCHILIIYTWSRNRGDRDIVTTGLLTEYPDAISDL